MGTGGALRLAYTRFIAGQRFFAMNGDSILQVPFDAMFEAHLRGIVPRVRLPLPK